MLNTTSYLILMMASFHLVLANVQNQMNHVATIRSAFTEASKTCPNFDMRMHMGSAGTTIAGWGEWKKLKGELKFSIDTALSQCLSTHLCGPVLSGRDAEKMLYAARQKCDGVHSSTNQESGGEEILEGGSGNDFSGIEEESSASVQGQNFTINLPQNVLLSFLFGIGLGGLLSFLLTKQFDQQYFMPATNLQKSLRRPEL